MGGGSTTRQDINLSPEASRLMTQELTMFLENFLPAQQHQQGQALQGLGPLFGQTAGAQGTQRAQATARNATRTAGNALGTSPAVSSGALREVGEGEGLQLEALRQLFATLAMQQNSLVDPRFAQFLKPDITSSSSPDAASQAAAGASTALAVAGTIAAIY